jgi:hypothetical protein
MTEHITHEMLQLLADGALYGDAARSVQNHLGECADCSATFATMVKFDRFVRAMPLPVLRREFPQDLLSRLGIRPPTPFLFRIVEHAASVVAVFLVVLMGVTIGALLSLSNGGEGANQELPGQKVLSPAVKWMETAYGEFGDWLSRIVPLVFGSQTAKIVVMLLLMVPLVALVDWLVGRKGAEGEL